MADVALCSRTSRMRGTAAEDMFAFQGANGPMGFKKPKTGFCQNGSGVHGNAVTANNRTTIRNHLQKTNAMQCTAIMFACMPACTCVCMNVCMHACMSSTCMHACHACCMQVCNACTCARTCTYARTCTHTNLHTYNALHCIDYIALHCMTSLHYMIIVIIHTYIHTIPTDLQTHNTYTYTCMHMYAYNGMHAGMCECRSTNISHNQ